MIDQLPSNSPDCATMIRRHRIDCFGDCATAERRRLPMALPAKSD